ncbi:unconventional myosin-VIIa [Clarias gariepinus]|uniref:unconventional myosin-VIIb n=1 Tax=Clarias gariepinus TaxID=13013 RepID=UPI00234E2AC8|nr:unconventional myosin-VIIb [Clarias gariepinus]
MVLSKGDHVWVDVRNGVPVGARVKALDGRQVHLLDDEGKERCVSESEQASLRLMHPTSVEGVDDMIKLGDLTEAGVLRNLLIRHKQDIIYTYIGSVLVAVNPYQLLPIYTGDQVRLYHGRRLGELPPHVFAIADCCYYNMQRNQRNQCCIISGESGAGKTESTKLILQFLAAVSGQHSWIEQQILQSNPVLEAFGNAKTTRNDNSSRFGKYIEIFFNKDGVIEGAHIEQYLLEKSRVCHQARMERNYHIFYCLLSGMPKEHKKMLLLGDATEFNYLTEGSCISCDGRDDAEEFERVRTALKVLTFSDRECWDIFKLLAAILHLGNIKFEGGTVNYMDACEVILSEHFTAAAKLLEVDKEHLEASLTSHTIVTKQEQLTKPLSSEQALDCRDALAKAVYTKLFMWIFGKMNGAIHKQQTSSSYTQRSIGLLDIFGFENFRVNSFEQLCINYANEQLQQFFVEHIFKLEQEEYLKEGVKWKNISYSDNQHTLDLLASQPLNLLSLIDEETHFPKGTDKSMVEKMNNHHSSSKIYVPPKANHILEFGVRHFAGVVYYDCKGFLEKNRDVLSLDIITLIQKSSSKMLKLIFETELNTCRALPVTNNNNNHHHRRVIIKQKKPTRPLQQGSEQRRQISTLSGQFRQSLDSLMKALSLCQPFFIRCFKPNDSKLSMVFDRDLCMEQLRYSGVLETIKIRRLGYPIQHRFEEFLGRYRVLLKSTECDPSKESVSNCCVAICRAVIKSQDDWRIGKTKIFLKDHHDSFLEIERERELNRKALIIQRVMLGHRDRKNFIRKRGAAVTVQRSWRSYKEQKEIKILRRGLMRLQALVRAKKRLLQYQRERAAAVTLQKQTRRYLAAKDLRRKQDSAVVLLQAQTRGLLARRRFKHLKDDAFSSAREDQDRLERQEHQHWELANVKLQQKTILQTDETQNKQEEKRSEEEMVEDMFRFLPKSTERQEVLSKSVTREERIVEPKKDEVTEKAVQIVITPATVNDNNSDEEEEKKEEEDKHEDHDDYYDDYDDEFSFAKFAAMHFQHSATHTYIQQRLKSPLLYHEDEGEALACLTVWWIILRFMGDISEQRTARMSITADLIQQHLGQRQGRRLSHFVGLDQKILRKKQKQNNKRKHSTIVEEGPMEDIAEEDDIMIGEGPSLDRPMTTLEKLHIIVGYGLRRPHIRDEIYCQILKQLSENTDRMSRRKGWILLSICLGIFPPTELLIQYVEHFIHRGPAEFSSSCAERLQRTLTNGERKEVPCWIELDAVEMKKPMKVDVTLADGRVLTLPIDSASVSSELCRAVAKKINLKDTFGFSIYISYRDKNWSLGSTGQHVLDAISQCEQEERRQGQDESGAPWGLAFRKEFFTPWHDCTDDPISTELIYTQIIHDLQSGEYQCDEEDDYVQLAAKHYYIKYGKESSRDKARSIVWECLSLNLIENKSEVKLVQLVGDAHEKGTYVNSGATPDSVKAEVVEFARLHWPIYFSKFYEASVISGPGLPEEKLVVAVNWYGVSFQEGKERTYLKLPYTRLTGVQIVSEGRMGEVVRLSTLRDEYKLVATYAHHMVELLSKILNGLKERSVYALALQDCNRPDDATFLSFKKEDLINIIKDGQYASGEGWINGTNDRTGQSGAVSTDAIMILHTLRRPSDDVLGSRKSLMMVPSSDDLAEKVTQFSLKEFSYEFFREPSKDAGRQGKARVREKLWVRSREPLKQPLLRSLQKNSELSQLACTSYSAILKYMGDYPVKTSRNHVELTDLIYGPALEHPDLRDEVYCQIMKQLTNNNNGLSTERGWQLLWLCCGLFPPSPALVKHTQRFIESRPREPLSAACLQRLQGMLSLEARTSPPHQVEVDAIQQNSSQIFHKVHFPDNTADLYEVTTTTRIRDLCRSIANQLMLSSPDGYSLFVKTSNKVVSMNEQLYFFDDLKELTDAPKKAKKGKEQTPTTVPYLVLFMRKLWFNVIPGKDLKADLMFHFPQELPKYLHGYHSVEKEDLIELAGLLFRVRVDADRSQFVMIPKMMKDLVPFDQHKIMSTDDWKKHIISVYNKQAGITVDEAKVRFLKIIASWPTFGCVFFEVKQTSERSYPSLITISISKQGVSLIDPKTKEVLVMHPFSKITNWSSGTTYFHLTIGNLVKGTTLLCETSMGYRMDDLLTSYVNMYHNMHDRALMRQKSQRLF